MNKSEKLNLPEIIDITVESGLQLIPVVGGTLSSAYFGTKQAKEFKRLENFYKILSEELNSIKIMILPIENQYEDGLVSLIEQINYRVEKEHQEVKINKYKKYMKSILTTPITLGNYDSIKVFLDILSSMSLLEIEIISFMYKNRDKGYIPVKNISNSGVHQYAIVGAISKIKSYGFLSTQHVDFSISEGVDNSLQEQIFINDYGVEFVEFTIE